MSNDELIHRVMRVGILLGKRLEGMKEKKSLQTKPQKLLRLHYLSILSYKIACVYRCELN